MKEWQGRNELLQNAYKDYRFASKQKDKDTALAHIKMNLEWGPFTDLCFNHGADVYGINSKYGIDTMTDKCIGLIDKVANGELDNVI